MVVGLCFYWRKQRPRGADAGAAATAAASGGPAEWGKQSEMVPMRRGSEASTADPSASGGAAGGGAGGAGDEGRSRASSFGAGRNRKTKAAFTPLQRQGSSSGGAAGPGPGGAGDEAGSNPLVSGVQAAAAASGGAGGRGSAADRRGRVSQLRVAGAVAPPRELVQRTQADAP